MGGAYICLSQCRPNVMKLIRRYEKENASFPSNVKTFVSTHAAVRYLQCKMRGQMANDNGNEHNRENSETSEDAHSVLMVELSHPKLPDNVTPALVPNAKNAEVSVIKPLDEINIDVLVEADEEEIIHGDGDGVAAV